MRKLGFCLAVVVAAALAVAAPGGTHEASDSAPRPVVARGDLLVALRSSGRLAVLHKTGKLVRRIPRFRAPNGTEEIELAPDRRHAFVSVFTHPPRLYEVDLATGAKHRMADGVSPTLSPDRQRLAYVATKPDVDIDVRTALIIRDLHTGAIHTIPLGPEPPAVGTPPDVIINWSPDGKRVGIYDDDRIRLVDAQSAPDVRSQPAGPRGLAPVFLTNRTMIVLANCCIGRQRLVSVDLDSGKRMPFALISSPVVNIRRLGSGRFLTVTALDELAVTSRGHFRVISRGTTAAAR